MPAADRVAPPVTVISIGGTIAMTPSVEGDGVAPSLGAEDLIREVPDLDRVASLSAVALERLPGAHLGFGDVVGLAARVRSEIEGGAAGVVVTQGTDTLEEVAFALDLLLEPGPPVIVTGAMRNPSLHSADGPGNLDSAVRVAASPEAAGLGVLVVLDEEIHSARLVQKRHTTGLGAFGSFPGRVGWLSEGGVAIALRPEPRPGKALEPRGEASVALLTSSLGDDGELIERAGEAYGGIVIEALGGGHLPLAAADRAADLASRMPVVFSARTGRGAVLRSTYDFPGSEMDLIRRGLIPSGSLDGPKARVLLSLLLMAGRTGDEIRERFAAHQLS